MLVEFSLAFLQLSKCVEKILQFMVFTFPENTLNLSIFTDAPVPYSNFQVECFKNLFSKDQRGGGNYDLVY